MKHFICALLLLVSASASAVMQMARSPSKLSNCSQNGWNLSRLIDVDKSFQLQPSVQPQEDDKDVCVAKMTIAPDEKQISSGWRAEIQDPLFPPQGAHVHYAFRTFVPRETLENTQSSFVITQWHDNKKKGLEAQRPPLAHRVDGHTFRVTLWNQSIWEQQGADGTGLILFSEDLPTDRWIDFEYDVVWSDSQEGRVDGWVDGKQVIAYKGPVGYAADPTAPYLKMGVYTVHPFQGPMTVYHSDYTRAYYFNDAVPRNQKNN